MQKTIPAHLVSAYQVMQSAFPSGIEEQEYLPLLSILYEHLSDRSLAQVIAEYTGRNYHVVLNDVYRVGATAAFPTETVKVVKQKLMHSDYKSWLTEERLNDL